MLLAPLVLAAAQMPANDAGIPRDWIATSAQGASIHLGEDGRFVFRSREKGNPVETLSGRYVVQAPPAGMAVGGFAKAKMVKLDFDLASLRKVGVSQEELDGLTDLGFTRAEGMRLTYVPSVPVLTDVQTVHFVPVALRAEATKRLAKWMTTN